VASYVIRGGAEGKARLSVVSAGLAPSTALLLDAAGVGEGMRVLDVGCGGGDVTLALAQPVLVDGAPKCIHQITLENVRDAIVAECVATEAVLGPIERELDAFCAEPDTIVAFPRVFQVFGRRPE
jgi:cyclopropane fatty-acyl-phospholipid synthase-like methyltransferase